MNPWLPFVAFVLFLSGLFLGIYLTNLSWTSEAEYRKRIQRARALDDERAESELGLAPSPRDR